MKAAIFQYHRERGWSQPFPTLDSAQTLVVVFGASSYIEDPGTGPADIAAAFPTSCVVGCSSAGEIFEAAVDDDSLSVAVMAFDDTELAVAKVQCADPGESAAAGAALASELSDAKLRGVFVLSDGLSVNGGDLVRSMTDALGADVIVTGGLAGDADRFERTWVMSGNGLETGHVVAVGFYGDSVRIGHGSRGGWDIFGPEHFVTAAVGNVLFELDGRRALDVYRECLGSLADELPASGLLFPLAIRGADDGSGGTLVRTILAVDDASGGVAFAGDIPEGYVAQIMRVNADRLIGGAQAAAQMARRTHDGPVVCLSVSCVGRRLVLGERILEEAAAVLDALPAASLQVGFYSYGELSPHGNGASDLHNQTMTVTTIAED
jgi:hypothetical protein